MDNGQCNVIYFDPRASHESTHIAPRLRDPAAAAAPDPLGHPEVDQNVATVLAVFPQVHVCTTSVATVARLTDLDNQATACPTIILIQTPHTDPAPPPSLLLDDRRSPSPGTPLEAVASRIRDSELRGFHFLVHLYEEVKKRSLSRLCLPVILITGQHSGQVNLAPTASNTFRGRSLFQEPRAADAAFGFARFLDAGAVDVMTSPLSRDRLLALPAIAYRANKDTSRRASLFGPNTERKRSWCGVDNDTKPYAYLREAMVTSLMDGICNPEYIDQSVNPTTFRLAPDRRKVVADAIGSWSFSAHDLDEDELLYAALLMLQHTLQMPALAKWHMAEDHIISFLLATRKVYNSFVLYHNFRHACDVCQALFYFLLQIEALPPYPSHDAPRPTQKTPLAGLLGPFHALTLLIAAIGHDVGHPGVNNLFLVTLNAPLAQLYSDRSVLECFHCAAYTQILRKYWPVAFSDMSMRKFMVNAILATDMGLHTKYITQLKTLQDVLSDNPHAHYGFGQATIDEHVDLLCCLLIKCADICNAARPIDIATRWAKILIDEFANQGDMEKELNIPTCLFGGPPVRDDLTKTAQSQIGFMDAFAGPLFSGIASIFPTMQFAVDEIARNRAIWQSRAAEATAAAEPRRASVEIKHNQSPARETHTADSKRKSEPLTSLITGLRTSPSPRGHKTGAHHSSASPPTSRKTSGGHAAHFQGLPPLNFDPARRPSMGPTIFQTPASPLPTSTSRRGSATLSSAHSTPRFYRPASSTYVEPMHHLDGMGFERLGLRGDSPFQSPQGSFAGDKVPRNCLVSQQSDDKSSCTTKDEFSGASGAPTGSDQTWTSGSSVNPDRGRKKKTSNPFDSLKFWRRKSRSVDSAMRESRTHLAVGKRSSPPSGA